MSLTGCVLRSWVFLDASALDRWRSEIEDEDDDDSEDDWGGKASGDGRMEAPSERRCDDRGYAFSPASDGASPYRPKAEFPLLPQSSSSSISWEGMSLTGCVLRSWVFLNASALDRWRSEIEVEDDWGGKASGDGRMEAPSERRCDERGYAFSPASDGASPYRRHLVTGQNDDAPGSFLLLTLALTLLVFLSFGRKVRFESLRWAR